MPTPTPKRRYKVKPTTKQLNALAIKKAKGDTISWGEAMRQAGYSMETSRTPGHNLLGGSAPMRIVDQFTDAYLHYGIGIPQLAAVNAEALVATKVVNSYTEKDREVPDHLIRLKAREAILEDIGVKQQMNNQTNIQVNLGELKDQYKKEGE